jgi:hypothetical protein
MLRPTPLVFLEKIFEIVYSQNKYLFNVEVLLEIIPGLELAVEKKINELYELVEKMSYDEMLHLFSNYKSVYFEGNLEKNIFCYELDELGNILYAKYEDIKRVRIESFDFTRTLKHFYGNNTIIFNLEFLVESTLDMDRHPIILWRLINGNYSFIVTYRFLLSVILLNLMREKISYFDESKFNHVVINSLNIEKPRICWKDIKFNS